MGNVELMRKFSKTQGKITYNLRKNGNLYGKSVIDKIDFGFWCNS